MRGCWSVSLPVENRRSGTGWYLETKGYVEEMEKANFEYEFNEIVVNQLGDLDPQYVIDMETIKEILLLEQQENLSGGYANLLRSKRHRHSEAYKAYREVFDSDV